MTRKEKEIRESLLAQLRAKGADVAHFREQVEDYVFMFGQVAKMKADIRKRGRSYAAISAAGKEYEKDNPAVKDVVMYNKQMLAILKELDLTTGNAGMDDEDEL